MITAGADGIGLEIARAFAREGARVHVCDVSEKALEQLARTDPAITHNVCDVASRDQVALDSWARQCLAEKVSVDPSVCPLVRPRPRPGRNIDVNGCRSIPRLRRP